MIVGFLDTECTGLDLNVDQVIEIGLHVEETSPRRRLTTSKHWRCRPTVPIHPQAYATHGISREMLAGEPDFAEHSVELCNHLQRLNVIAGYNLDFDLQMLRAEWDRNQLGLFPLAPSTIQLDVYKLWRAIEPRDLGSAHRRFVGVPIDGAHQAVADAKATSSVLSGMLEHFGLTMLDFDRLADIADPARATRFGPSDHFKWENGQLCITFGAHKGKAIAHLAAVKPDYLQWMIKNNFPSHVVEACRKALTMSATAFHAWAKEQR